MSKLKFLYLNVCPAVCIFHLNYITRYQKQNCWKNQVNALFTFSFLTERHEDTKSTMTVHRRGRKERGEIKEAVLGNEKTTKEQLMVSSQKS